MECFLDHHSRNWFLPDGTASRLSSFAHDDIAVLKSVTIHFVMLEPHLAYVVEVELAPAHVDVREIGQGLTPVLFAVKHLAQAEVGDLSQGLYRPPHAPNSSKFS